MSFGFSVSDFMGLARMACKLYAESHEALANCEAFRRELYLFSETLVKTALLLRYNAPNDAVLVESDKATLTACAQSCKELIYGQICGAANVPLDDDMIATGSHGISDLRIRPPSSQDGHSRYLRSWRLKRADRKFAAKIPKFQQAIFAHSQTLSALHTLIILYVIQELGFRLGTDTKGNLVLINLACWPPMTCCSCGNYGLCNSFQKLTLLRRILTLG